MFILDTNTVIYLFKGLGDVSKNLMAHSPASIGIPTVVLFELESGITKSPQSVKRRSQLLQLLNVVRTVPFGVKEAQVSAQVRSKLEKAGTKIGPYDNLIAGSAIANGATLVTHNVREFERVPGLNVVDWY